ncbi:MAG TPA: ATP-binding protein [Acidobacteriaceae bacterium]|nr:ATP-binding protein [Acidobacteriaceae bacterium]
MSRRLVGRRLARLPIRVRLMVLSTVTSTCALVLACLTFWTYETAINLQTLHREATTIAQMLGDGVSAALTFNDAVAARETANTLRAEPRVAQACFYTLTGRAIASYQRRDEAAVCPESRTLQSFRFSWGHASLYYPVSLNHEIVGSLYLRIGLAEIYTRSLRYGLISAIVLLLASVFALGISARLQRMISEPILHLTHVAREVSGSGSYDLRAVKTFDDETGLLIDQFNDMMEKINDRDMRLQRAQDELEMRVADRTRTLEKEIAERKVIEQSLVNAKLAAEEANAAKSVFLANMSHELRTPLNAILGYSEMLEEDAVENGMNSCAKDLHRIQSAGHHLLALVNDILDISKIEAGALDLRPELCEIGALTEPVIATIEPLASRNGNRFVVEATNVTGIVSVDPLKFRQSLINLLSNACKFTERGTVSLSIVREQDGGREFIAWQVKDTGIGIDREDLNRLFRPFSQVDASVTRRHGGTGLGLAISQRLCRLMGGDITVVSRPGEGSTFTLHMPAAHPDTALQADDGQPLALA